MRIQADKLVAVPLAKSDQMRVGDFVVAVGNPVGFSQTVTSGIVSAVRMEETLRPRIVEAL